MGVDFDMVLLLPTIDSDDDNVSNITKSFANLRLTEPVHRTGLIASAIPGLHAPARAAAPAPHSRSPAREVATDLPTHHVQAITDVLGTTETATVTDLDKDDGSDSGHDNSGDTEPRNLEAFRHFLDACDYIHDSGGSNDNDGDDGYELTWP